eukprot:m.76472 g.76472  ORF g.76472 m.76472 type:complete len:192 (+) comp14512_c0_seq2:350-925(+)
MAPALVRAVLQPPPRVKCTALLTAVILSTFVTLFAILAMGVQDWARLELPGGTSYWGVFSVCTSTTDECYTYGSKSLGRVAGVPNVVNDVCDVVDDDGDSINMCDHQIAAAMFATLAAIVAIPATLTTICADKAPQRVSTNLPAALHLITGKTATRSKKGKPVHIVRRGDPISSWPFSVFLPWYSGSLDFP